MLVFMYVFMSFVVTLCLFVYVHISTENCQDPILTSGGSNGGKLQSVGISEQLLCAGTGIELAGWLAERALCQLAAHLASV